MKLNIFIVHRIYKTAISINIYLYLVVLQCLAWDLIGAEIWKGGKLFHISAPTAKA